MWFCAACLASIERVQPPLCPLCGSSRRHPGLCPTCQKKPLSIDGIRAVTYHEGIVRKGIHRFKYWNLQELAEPLGHLLSDYLRSNPLPIECIIPVPLHETRMKERGYNQAELLAGVVSNDTGLPLLAHSLHRIKRTLPQVELGADERLENVRGAFRCSDQAIEGKRILLIDDVTTTGATLEACSQALQEAGAVSVWGLVIARPR